MAIEYRTDPEYFEYLDGRVYPKVSPRSRHAAVQGRMQGILLAHAGKRGVSGPEWKFRIGMVDGTKSALLPDIAFVSLERLLALAPADREEPPIAPDLAIEVRSPSNRKGFLERKIARYLACGSVLVLDIDPESRTIDAHDASGSRRFSNGERFEHPALPWLAFDVADAFSDLDLFES